MQKILYWIVYIHITNIYIYIYKSRDFMRESVGFCYVVLYMSSILFNLSPHLISLSMTNLSHKCRKLRNLVPPPFPTSWTLPLLISLISKIKGFLHSMLVFHVIILVIWYIPFSQNIEEQKKSRRERERISVKRVWNWLWF